MKGTSKRISRVQVVETFAVFALVSLLPAVFSQRQKLTILTLALLFVALFMKPLAEVVAGWWLKLSRVLSDLNNRIILTIIFYLVLTPIARIYRLFNKDTLNLDRNEPGSFYAERNHTYDKSDLQKMW